MAIQKQATGKSQGSLQLKSLTEKADFEKNPKKGISHLKIIAEQIENIPGHSPRWEEEIQLRIKEIISFDQKNFMQRTLSVMKRETMTPWMSGEELMKLHPVKNAQKLAEQLKLNPKNVMNRLELVSTVIQSKREFAVGTYRELLLQACVSSFLGDLSIEGLKIVLLAQSSYLNKLYSHCRTQQNKIQGYLESTSERASGSFKENRLILMKKSREIHTNMNLIKVYQHSLGKAAKTTHSASHLSLDLNQLSQSLVNQVQSSEGNRDVKILKSAFLLVQVMRYLPLLHPVAHELSDLLMKYMPDHPIGGLLKGRLAITTMTFAVSRYEAGEQNPEVQQEIQNAFKQGYSYYGIAIRTIGKAKDDMESSILYEYAQTIHYFYNTAKSLLKLKMPQEWLTSSFSKAKKALSLAIESEPVYQLRKSIYNDMIVEGIAVPK
ncbi:MAG: hypothetical protein HQM13_06570 [SAR324 cluster bacterium]|nr:hypothetical protein [SAR324 cluster bacterium]